MTAPVRMGWRCIHVVRPVFFPFCRNSIFTQGSRKGGELCACGLFREMSSQDDLQELREEWQAEQARLRSEIVMRDNFDWTMLVGKENSLRLVGGVDISFYKDVEQSDQAVAALVVLHYPDLSVVYEDFELVNLEIPYMAGYLGFRECPAFLKLLERAAEAGFDPQVILVDGNGILHPRGCGSASHLGVLSGYPTVGVAKNLHCIEGLQEHTVKQEVRRRMEVPSHMETADGGTLLLAGNSGRTVGAALYGHGKGTVQPIYVSIGHRVSLETAVALVKACANYRVPEPIRAADISSRRFIREQKVKKG